MAIYKIYKNRNYTTISNYHLKDKNLSLKAKGLLSLMLSLPENWDYSVRGLEKICLETKNTINGILNELETNNYLERKKIYCNGKISDWEYSIYENKNLCPKNQDIENWDINNNIKEYSSCCYLNLNNNNSNNRDISNIYDLNITKEERKEKEKKEEIEKQETIYEYYESNFGRTISSIEYEKLKSFLEMFSDDIVRYAIEIAVVNNKRTFSYVRGILNNWKACGYKTLQEIKDNEQNKKNEIIYEEI